MCTSKKCKVFPLGTVCHCIFATSTVSIIAIICAYYAVFIFDSNYYFIFIFVIRCGFEGWQQVQYKLCCYADSFSWFTSFKRFVIFINIIVLWKLCMSLHPLSSNIISSLSPGLSSSLSFSSSFFSSVPLSFFLFLSQMITHISSLD